MGTSIAARVIELRLKGMIGAHIVRQKAFCQNRRAS